MNDDAYAFGGFYRKRIAERCRSNVPMFDLCSIPDLDTNPGRYNMHRVLQRMAEQFWCDQRRMTMDVHHRWVKTITAQLDSRRSVR